MKILLDELIGKRAQNFFDIYDLENIVSGSEKKWVLGNKQPRICRYCKKGKPEVKFKKDAHIISEFMGNEKLLSYFECDTCNDLFSKYENSFANFLGATRTISQIKGKSGVPKFKDPKTGFKIELGDKTLQIGMLENSKEVTIEEDIKKLTIKTKRLPYIPIQIPKILVKMGLALVKEESMSDFEFTRNFVISDKHDSSFLNNALLIVLGYFIPGPPVYRKPFLHLYTKKDEKRNAEVPQKQIVLFYANYILQMILPFNENDKNLQGKQINLPIYPLLLDASYFVKYGNYQQLNLNFTSSDRVSDQDHIINFSFEDMKREI